MAASLGGLCWIVKGALIMLTGEQPPFMFEIAPVFFALGAVGLYVQLQGSGGRTALMGFCAALLSVLLAITDIALYELGLVGQATKETFSPTTFGSFVALIASLILLGIVHRRASILPPVWRSLPLALGILTFPLSLIGAVLETLDPRLFELPIVVLGVAWMLLGSVQLTDTRRVKQQAT